MSTPIARNVPYFWTGSAWAPVDTVGPAGPAGAIGPEGVRPSCGGCSHVGGQASQANSAMTDAANFVADPTYAADTDPCLQIFDTSTLQTRRTGTFVITASVMLNGKGTTSGSSCTIKVSQSGGAYVDIARGPIPKGSDRGAATSIATLGVGDKLRFGLWIVTAAPPTKLDLTVMAAVLP